MITVLALGFYAAPIFWVGLIAILLFSVQLQMIFQDPYASLNPRRRVGRIIAKGPIAQGSEVDAAMAKALDLLELVGLDRACASRYPHEFSSRQRQRIGIARSLALASATRWPACHGAHETSAFRRRLRWLVESASGPGRFFAPQCAKRR